MGEDNKIMKILWAVCLIPLIIGILLLSFGETREEYPTSEYWVARDYQHVYEKYSGQIVNKIGENERCEIKGDTIIVTTRNAGVYGVGFFLTALFGMFTIGLVWGNLESGEWIRNIIKKFKEL